MTDSSRKITNAINRHIETISAIASAPSFDQFVVGISSDSTENRFKSYRAKGFKHYVALSDCWGVDSALEMERQLQETCKQWPEYSDNHRNDRHRRSIGGKSREAAREAGTSFHVYIAW